MFFTLGLPDGELLPIADTSSITLRLNLGYHLISRHYMLPAPDNYQGETQHMPYFREMIQVLPPQLQFNIEIKYPMPVSFINLTHLESELSSAKLHITKDEYVNAIVKELQSMHSTRVIYISSFDLDVCLMLLHKQAMYPVFLLLGL